LGLSFVKQVVEDHDGVISCLERELGSGACFEMVFPQFAPRPAASPDVQASVGTAMPALPAEEAL
jgi:nitrogen-specific signal transduction histidine kinase